MARRVHAWGRLAHGRSRRKPMTRIVVFMEGGGEKKEGKAALRKGMDAFLNSAKAVARRKSLRWRVVACGSRNQAYRQFRAAVAARTGDLPFLLVDSEDGVMRSPRAHLTARDGWDRLDDVAEDLIQLMVRTMETWLIADLEAVQAYYGRNFKANSLPRHRDLEQVPKQDVSSGLERATAQTQKGRYHKITHASELLARIDPEKVKVRCWHCERLFDTLISEIEAA